ncbi:MAG: VOC family protein [Litorilinea sp.]
MTTYVKGLAEIVLWVQDKTAAVQFYSELLGLPVISPPTLPNVFLQVGEGHTGVPQMIVLVPLPPDRADQPRQGQLHHLAFELPARDFDAQVERLLAAGYQPRGGKHPVLAARTIYVDDPDGNEVELICMHEDQ